MKAAPSTKKIILDSCEKISRYKLGVIRKAIEKYQKDLSLSGSYNVDSMSGLYVLNRYLFNVPDNAPLGNGTFGGWGGVPETDKGINWLWPLSIDADNHFDIIGTYHGYGGQPYLAVWEFDHFNEKYKPRSFVKK